MSKDGYVRQVIWDRQLRRGGRIELVRFREKLGVVDTQLHLTVRQADGRGYAEAALQREDLHALIWRLMDRLPTEQAVGLARKLLVRAAERLEQYEKKRDAVTSDPSQEVRTE